jgi:hypothetical protein
LFMANKKRVLGDFLLFPFQLSVLFGGGGRVQGFSVMLVNHHAGVWVRWKFTSQLVPL